MSWWDDIVAGTRAELGSYTFTEDEIVRFAREYDPQPFHIDPDVAARSVFGGIIASGWHTVAIWMKLAVAHNTKFPKGEAGNMISPGFENLKWLKPVRPGMTLFYSSEVAGKRSLASRPGWDLVTIHNEAREAGGAVVMSFTGKVFAKRQEG